jgi:hypothetical protein
MSKIFSIRNISNIQTYTIFIEPYNVLFEIVNTNLISYKFNTDKVSFLYNSIPFTEHGVYALTINEIGNTVNQSIIIIIDRIINMDVFGNKGVNVYCTNYKQMKFDKYFIDLFDLRDITETIKTLKDILKTSHLE